MRSILSGLFNDSATANLITSFYSHLSNPELSKAQALQAAQKEVIAASGVTQHPSLLLGRFHTHW